MNKDNNYNIYHCCFQKTGSQWFPKFFSDKRIFEATNLELFYPNKNYFRYNERKNLKNGFPVNSIISPLYIRYNDFIDLKKPKDYKVIYIMRDPRDLIVSWYFSIKYSHVIISKQQEKIQKMLNKIDNDQRAINYILKLTSYPWQKIYNINSIKYWYQNKKHIDLKIFKFEDLFGKDSFFHFESMLKYLEIDISNEELSNILCDLSFSKFSSGRETGQEDVKSHYRKGVSGDWKNYFNHSNIYLCKKKIGKLLIELDYEQDFQW
jgi:hypothetical protein